MTEPGMEVVSGRSIYPQEPRLEDLARQIATGVVAHGATVSGTGKTASPGAALVRLADRLGIPVSELISDIPEDTLRRTRYPVKEQRQPDGTTVYEHDLGIVEGRNASVRP